MSSVVVPVDSALLTPAEIATLEALVTEIIPDRPGPSARATGIVPGLERLVAASAERQALYRQGLVAFERLARRRGARRLAELTWSDRERLLDEVERAVQRTRWVRHASLGARLRRRLWLQHYTAPGLGGRGGMGDAVRFFPRLVEDAMALFYTNRATWDWLAYDGPPMPEGYPMLDGPRETDR